MTKITSIYICNIAFEKNKDLVGELVAAAPSSSAENRAASASDGDDSWRAFYEHPLTAATTAMLNIGGSSSEEQNAAAAMGLLCEYYKLPFDKLDKALVDKYGPELWPSILGVQQGNLVNGHEGVDVNGQQLGAVNGHQEVDVSEQQLLMDDPPGILVNGDQEEILVSREHHGIMVNREQHGIMVNRDHQGILANRHQHVIGNGASSSVSSGSFSVSILSQAEELLQNRRLTDPPEMSAQEVDIYLSRGLVKREIQADEEELVVPSTSSGILDTQKSEVLKNGTGMNGTSETSVSPLPLKTHVKQEASPGLPTSPDSPQINRELPPASSVIAQAYSKQGLAPSYESLGVQYTTAAPPQYPSQAANSIYMMTAPNDFRSVPDYYTEHLRQTLAASAAASNPAYSDASDTAAYVDRLIRQNAGYKGSIPGLAVDLPSPDSGIGDTTVTTRDASSLPQVGEHVYDYGVELGPVPPPSAIPVTGPVSLPGASPAPVMLQKENSGASRPSRPASTHSGSSRRSWHEYGRNSEADKVQIPKLHSDVGFRYFLETPISTSQRREDDRITYINKGQFYGITMEYIPDPDKPLKSSTVKSVVMLMFREEKPPDEELKAWQFWHSRQHSVKQRILDADTKNSTGIIGQIEEITHNAIAFYWNPMESPAKVNVAVQCLSTDFSNQKGVKGLPLHLQIDTFDDFRDTVPPHHRGYCQIKVFCDKGAERKTRDEERRAAKRKLAHAANNGDAAFPGRKKLEDMYHLPCERSEFYSMSDLLKPPVLFTPVDEVDKISSMDLSFYGNHSSQAEDQLSSITERRDSDPGPPAKRMKLYPNDRVLLYVRQEGEETFQALHINPPSLAGLARGIEKKYNISSACIRHFYRRTKKGITVQVDDDIVKHYCNEDTCLIERHAVDKDMCDITLVEF